VVHQLPELADEDAGKSADQGRAGRAPGARSQPLEHWLGPQAQLAWVALCIRAVAPSVGRSCAGPEHWVSQALPGGALPLEAQQKPQLTVSMRPQEQQESLAVLEARLPWAQLQQPVFALGR